MLREDTGASTAHTLIKVRGDPHTSITSVNQPLCFSSVMVFVEPLYIPDSFLIRKVSPLPSSSSEENPSWCVCLTSSLFDKEFSLSFRLRLRRASRSTALLCFACSKYPLLSRPNSSNSGFVWTGLPYNEVKENVDTVNCMASVQFRRERTFASLYFRQLHNSVFQFSSIQQLENLFHGYFQGVRNEE